MAFLLHRLAGLPPPDTLGGRFAGVIELLRQGIGDHADRTRLRPPDPRVLLIWRYVGRLLTRFLALLAKVQAGTLRPPRRRPTRVAAPPSAAPPPAGPEADPTATGPPPRPPPPPPRPPRLPRGFAWLFRHIPPGPAIGNPIAAGADCLRTLLTDPEMAALIAAAPQAGRMLRPLCQALGVALPEALRLPPRPRRPRRPSPEVLATRAARAATRAAARAEAAWGRRLRRQLGLPARQPADPPTPPAQARPPPKRA